MGIFEVFRLSPKSAGNKDVLCPQVSTVAFIPTDVLHKFLGNYTEVANTIRSTVGGLLSKKSLTSDEKVTLYKYLVYYSVFSNYLAGVSAPLR